MISIEAHRAAIGRFSRKAKFYSLSSALKKNECIEVTLFTFQFGINKADDLLSVVLHKFDRLKSILANT